MFTKHFLFFEARMLGVQVELLEIIKSILIKGIDLSAFKLCLAIFSCKAIITLKLNRQQKYENKKYAFNMTWRSYL